MKGGYGKPGQMPCSLGGTRLKALGKSSKWEPECGANLGTLSWADAMSKHGGWTYLTRFTMCDYL